MVQSGVAYAHSAGEIEYLDMPITFSNDKFYLQARTPLLMTASMGNVVGGHKTGEQRTIVLSSRSVDRPEFDWETHNPHPTRTTTLVTGKLPTGTRGVASEYTVTDASIFKPYDRILNTATNEVLLIVATNTNVSPQEITAYPAAFMTGFDGITSVPASLTAGTPSAKTNGDTVIIIGNSQQEGGVFPSITDTEPQRTQQYCQIIRDGVGVTSTYNASKHNGKETYADMKERKKGEFLRNYEDAIILSRIDKQTISGKPVRSMQGIRQFASTNVYASSALAGGGNDITDAKLDQLADIFYTNSTGARAVGLCSGQTIRKLRINMKAATQTNVKVSDDVYGLKPLTYETAFGDIDFYRHPLFDNTGLSDEIFLFDPKLLELGHLNTQEMRFYDNEQAPGEKTMKGSWYGELTCMPLHEKTFVHVTGITYSFS